MLGSPTAEEHLDVRLKTIYAGDLFTCETDETGSDDCASPLGPVGGIAWLKSWIWGMGEYRYSASL